MTDVYIVESMSSAPFLGDRASFYTNAELPPHARFVPPVLGADRLAHAEGIARSDLDAVALLSQQRAVAAEDRPALQRSRIDTAALSREECLRPQTSAETLADTPPAFGDLQDQYAAALGGVRFAPLHSIAHALDAMDRIEFMEAFAVTIAKFLRDYDVDPMRVNVGGGHLAKGHPMGASGAILTSALLDALDACDGRLGLVVVTGAMGVGAALIVERIDRS